MDCCQKNSQIESYDDGRYLQEHAPELLPLVKEMSNALELTFLKVTGNLADPGSFPLAEFHEASLEMLLSRRLAGLSDAKQKMAINKVESANKNLKILREGRYAQLFELGAVDRLHQTGTIFEGATPSFLKKGAAFRRKFKSSPLLHELGQMGLPPATEESLRPELDKIALRIHRVKCLEETDSIGGDDEISLAAVITQPGGLATRLGPQVIGNDFDDGEEIYFGNWYYASYELWTPGALQVFPKLCQCSFILAEVDNGGLPEMVQTIFEKITAEVAAAVGAAVGAAAGGLIGSLAGPVGAAVGAAVGFIMGHLFRLFIEWWEDDLFPIATVGAMITSAHSRWAGGSTTSPQNSSYFAGHGGLYRLDYSWQFVK